ncbi:unnamed protein product [Meganyctiphanes norvegica]|uniref:NADH dehydrogenase subunit 5 n=1 Tax=Meganyctiphanes norvegica TaxID=48144 RepID=A0AAV2R406_MEGNR
MLSGPQDFVTFNFSNLIWTSSWVTSISFISLSHSVSMSGISPLLCAVYTELKYLPKMSHMSLSLSTSSPISFCISTISGLTVSLELTYLKKALLLCLMSLASFFSCALLAFLDSFLTYQSPSCIPCI